LSDPVWEASVVDCPGCRHLDSARQEVRECGDGVGRHPVLRRSTRDVWDDSDDDTDGLSPEDLVVMRWEPSTDAQEGAGAAAGLSGGMGGVTVFADFAARAGDGWVQVWDGDAPRLVDASPPEGAG